MDRPPRGRLTFEAALFGDQARLLWIPVAGLPLLVRQVLCLRHVGVVEIELAAEPIHHEVLRQALARLPASQTQGVSIADAARPADTTAPGTLILPASLVIDPRTLKALIQVGRDRHQSVTCVDRFAANYPASAKSPYVVGAPEAGEARLADASDRSSGTLMPFGAVLQRESPSLFLDVGRYFWHVMRHTDDAAEATTKILFGTFKPTDGLYAKTNRRVSMLISRVLLPTKVTPNQVTVFGLICCAVAGVVMAGGTYLSLVAGGFLAWFASMIDGVDGELARSRFQATELGQRLEWASDYVFYLSVVSGYGVGLYRSSGSRVWLYLAAIGLVGVLVSQLAVARDRRLHAKWEPTADYYLTFQRRTAAQKSNPFHRFTRLCNFLVHRGAFPYFIMAFNVLGLSKLMFSMIVVGTHLSWILTLYAGRLKPVKTPVAAVRPHWDRSADGNRALRGNR